MTRINTNVSSLTAQNRLQRTNNDLNSALTRLSTGLRINSGKDDPAGLIASESLRSDITSINKALSNTQRANQIIGTADSALGQVSSLLNDVRGLVTEAANKGALSDDEIAANQLQIDSSLEAINRIAQTTTFQGRRLLDGSLDFQVARGAGASTIKDLEINSANLGATGSLAVSVNITAAATKASISNTGITTNVAAVAATGVLSLADKTPAAEATGVVSFAESYANTAQATGTVTLANSETPNAEASRAFTLTGGGTLNVAAANGGTLDGEAGNGITVNITTSGGATTAAYNSGTSTLTINLTEGATTATAVTALSGLGLSDFAFSGGSATNVAAGDATSNTLTGGTNNQANFVISAASGGAADGTTGNTTRVKYIAGASTAAVYDATANELNVTVASGATVTQVATAIGGTADFNTSSVNFGAALFNVSDLNSIGSTPLSAGARTTTPSSLRITAANGSDADGEIGNDTTITFQTGAATGAAYSLETNTLLVTVASGATVANVASAIDGTAQFSATNTVNGAAFFNVGSGSTDLGTLNSALSGGTSTSLLSDTINLTNNATGLAGNNRTVRIEESATVTAGQAVGALDGNNIVVRVRNNGNTNISSIVNAINGVAGGGITAAVASSSNGDGVYRATGEAPPSSPSTLTGGVAGSGLNADLTFRLSGLGGSEVFSFKSGATIDNILQSVNLLSDATGIEASNNGGTIDFKSTTYGSASTVGIEVISEGSGGTFTSGLSTTRSAGTDVQATVNGAQANGKGNTLSLNTSTLSFNLTVADGSNTSVAFNINGGGAQFQLGPDVVSNQQARLGINSLNTAKLGGVTGRLFELVSGGARSLTNDVTGASKIVDEVIGKVTTLRGRLGAFQRTALDSNTASLSDTLANLNEAQSSIRDADFAKESSNLTRAQILVQSGTSVLGIANQSSQNVLSLLR